jgi:hypothetical protein
MAASVVSAIASLRLTTGVPYFFGELEYDLSADPYAFFQ